jgi:hypothetical protein
VAPKFHTVWDTLDAIKDTIDGDQANSPGVENLNNIHLFRLGSMDVVPGATPFLHWPLSRISLKEVLFDKVYLTSAYNPAHLARKLRGLGFEVSSCGRELKIQKRVESGPCLEMTGWNFLARMIGQYLVTDEVLVEMVQGVISLLERGDTKQTGRFELNVHQVLSGRRRSKSNDQTKPGVDSNDEQTVTA